MKVERDENNQRKEPTTSEKVALAEAIAERLQGRQLANLVQNRGGNISTSDETGKTRDILAQKVGLGSGKTLEAAQKVIERGIPELVEAMNTKKLARWPAFACVPAGEPSVRAQEVTTGIPVDTQNLGIDPVSTVT